MRKPCLICSWSLIFGCLTVATIIVLVGMKHNLQGDDQFLQVIDAYLKPKCHSADSEVVHRSPSIAPVFHLFRNIAVNMLRKFDQKKKKSCLENVDSVKLSEKSC